jgi:hypothetical protein
LQIFTEIEVDVRISARGERSLQREKRVLVVLHRAWITDNAFLAERREGKRQLRWRRTILAASEAMDECGK